MKMNRFSNRALAIVTALLLLFQQIPALAAAEEWNSAASDPIGTEDYVTVRFTADGEEVAALLVRAGAAIGRLPDAPEREGYAFLGWFAGEEPVTEETVVTAATEITASYINEAYPALRADYDNGRIAVRVSAPEGALPKGVSPVMETVSDELVRETVEGVMGHAVGQIAAVNISFLDENGSKIQPEKPVKVQIALTGMQADRVSVVHIPDELLPSPAKSGKKLMSARRGAAPAAEVVDFSVQGDTLSFDADSFSVYAVAEDKSAKFEFYYPGETAFEFENKLKVKTTYQMVPAGGNLYNPGMPEAPSDVDNPQFMGWWTKNGENWDTQIIPPDVESVVISDENLTAVPQKTVKLYARFDATYYIVYHDQTMRNVLVTEMCDSETNVTLKEDGKLRVELVLPADITIDHAFIGWSKEKDKTDESDVIPDPFDFDTEAEGTQHLYPVIAAAYWITFDKNDWKYVPNTDNHGAYDYDAANDKYILNPDGTGAFDRQGTGASYVAPRYVLQGENYQERYGTEVPESARPGYTFLGWFYEDGTPFNANITPTENITIYAKWRAEQTPYTVQYWLQNANGDGYELHNVDLKLWNGTADEFTDINASTVLPYDATTTVGNKYPHYTLHATSDPDDPYNIEQKQIAGDESTIIDVYYDCVTYTLRFIYARSSASGQTSYSYEPITQEEAIASGDAVYGYVNGNYTVLTKNNDGTWSYNSTTTIPYTGYRYRENDSNGTRWGIVNGNLQRIYYNNYSWRLTNNWNGTVYNGTVYERGTNNNYLLGWLDESHQMVELTRNGNTYSYSVATEGTYTGTFYTRTANNLQYQITEDVHHYWLHDSYSSSWATIRTGITNHNENWNNVSSKPQVTMKDGYVLGSFVDGAYTYYFLDITHLKYGEILTSVWPYNSLQEVGKSGSSDIYKFTSWGTQVNSPYWTDASHRTGDDGKYTIKGPYSSLDDMLMNADNNGNTIVNGSDLLAFVFLGRYKTTPNYYNYYIYTDLLESEEGERTYGGIDYKLYTIIENSTSTAPPRDQARLSLPGLNWVAGPLTANNGTPSGTSPSSGRADLYYYYKRDIYELNIYRNQEGDTGDAVDDHVSLDVKYGEDISGYLEDPSKNPFADYEVGVTRYTAESGEEFVFEGWYTVPEFADGLTPVDLEGKTMEGNLFIYAGWRPIRYRAWVQPNGGELSSSESTWFNLDYGEVIASYDDISRDYLRIREGETGEYYYVIYEYEAPRSAEYVKISEATEDQIAHALRDTSGNPVQYKYLKNAYTFVGWYQVLDEEFGTYEQYYANGNTNTGTYIVRPPTINESDKLSNSTYVFGTPVKDDIAIRGIWKRSGTIAVQFDPKMAGTDLKGTVPETEAAKTEDGKYILKYKGDGTPETISETATDEQKIYPLSEQVYADLSKVQAITSPIPPEGYYFVGWKTPYDTIVQANDIFTLYVDLAELMGQDQADGVPWYWYTLTAEYAKIETVSITYDYNASEMVSKKLTDFGGQEGNTAITTTTEPQNTISNLLLNQDVTLSTGEGFDRGSGYVLIGWSKTPGENNTVDFELGEEVDFVDDEDSTLYAVWQKWGWLEIGKHFDVQNPYLDGLNMRERWNSLSFTVTDSDGHTVKVKTNDGDSFDYTGIYDGVVEAGQTVTPSVTLEHFIEENGTSLASHEHQYYYYVWLPAGEYTVEEDHTQADNLMNGFTRESGSYSASATVGIGQRDLTKTKFDEVTNNKAGSGKANISNNYRGHKAYLDVEKSIKGDAPATLTDSKEYSFIVYNKTLNAYLAARNQSLDNLGGYVTEETAAATFTITKGGKIKFNGNNLNGNGKIPILPDNEYQVIEVEDSAVIESYEWEVTYVPATSVEATADDQVVTVTITNTYTLNTVPLTLQKTVTGNQANPNDSFSFTIGVFSDEGCTQAITNPTEGGWQTTVTRTGAQTANLGIGNIPIGKYVKITETVNAYETTTAKVNDGKVEVENGTVPSEARSIVFQVPVPAEGQTEIPVVFTNKWDLSIPMGIGSDSAPYVLAVSAAMMSAAVWMLLRRRAKAAGRED